MKSLKYTAVDAVISADEQYRYWLLREWDSQSAHLTVVMLNPSTADAAADDPTIRRCVSFAEREGFGGIEVVNLYAYRATDPKAMLTAVDPVGPENDQYLGEVFAASTHVLAAWGAHAKVDRSREVLALRGAGSVVSLGATKAGHPRHPLYVHGEQPFVPYALLG